jgi:hypothetical protein
MKGIEVIGWRLGLGKRLKRVCGHKPVNNLRIFAFIVRMPDNNL